MEPGWKWLKGGLYKHGPMTTKEALEAAGRAGYSTNRFTFAQYVLDLNRFGPDECDHRGSTTELLYKLDPPGQTLPNLPSTEIKGRLLAALSTDPTSWQVLMAEATVSSSGLLQVEISGLRHNYGVGIDGSRYLMLVTRESTGRPPTPQQPPQQVTLPKLKFLELDCCEADFQQPSTFSRST
ncbi:MAG: hypothetical protein ACLQF4_13290 [Xanthobacteraceae bacterium]